jgi:hypothetical protein
MSLSHRFLKLSRTIHLYLGVFTAPALLFFAITGGLQTFSLHETTRGSSYAPPAWLASAAQLHKKQTTVKPVRRPRPAEAGPAVHTSLASDAKSPPAGLSADKAAAPPRKNLLPMKLFFALVALGLAISTLSGLYMAWRYSRRPRLFGTVLTAGFVVPLLLLLF